MANAFATNFAIPATNNSFQLLWKLTRVMKKAGWTVTASSDGYIRDTTGVASADRWGGNADPSADTYPPNSLSDTVAGWIVMGGPRTVKIPLSANPTGTFIRGESVTQATSAATGELLGYVWDAVGLSGYAVIMPRTGTFDNSNIVTGALSAATFVPTGTVVVYGREVMFSKSPAASITGGQIFYICADVVSEASQFFSAIAAATTLPSTQITSGSNGIIVTNGTINVTSTAGFPSAGGLLVTTTNGGQSVKYTGTGLTQFTGCTGGTGNMATNNAVVALPTMPPGALNSGITNRMNGIRLPAPNIAVDDTRGFPTSGTININIYGSPQTITYTGISVNNTSGGANGSFTGCSGGSGILITGQSIGTFPKKGICIRGDLTTPLTGHSWFSAITTTFVATGNGQAACVNATPSAGVSADGSFYAVLSSSTPATTVAGFMYTRLDDTEPGDVDPYAFLINGSLLSSAFTNQSVTTSGNSSVIALNNIIYATSERIQFLGYAARGCPVTSRDVPSMWFGSLYSTLISGTHTIISGGTAAPTLLVNHPAATPPAIRDQFILFNNGLAAASVNTGIILLERQIKGKTRWINAVGGTVVPSDTFDSKTWLVVTTSATSTPGILFGPYDGTTTPVL